MPIRFFMPFSLPIFLTVIYISGAPYFFDGAPYFFDATKRKKEQNKTGENPLIIGIFCPFFTV